MEFADERVNRAGDLGVEACVRLVVEDQFRVSDQGAGDPDPLFHAARDIRGHQLPGVRDVDQLQTALDALPDRVFLKLGVLAQGERDVVANGEPVEQPAPLEDIAHALARLSELPARGPTDLLPEDLHAPRVRCEDADGVLEGDGLADARGAHDREGARPRELHGEAREDFFLAKALVYIREADDGVCGIYCVTHPIPFGWIFCIYTRCICIF